jgi:type II restriction/modification system DNA methylase subunit YeeA
MGTTKVGAFDIEFDHAMAMLSAVNPNGRPTSDVLRPFKNGSDIVRFPSNRWIIDFGVSQTMSEASLYQTAFEHVRVEVEPSRRNNGRQAYREKWWIHGEARPGFRDAVRELSRYIATARVAKHRIFVWLESVVLPDSKVIAITYDDDTTFGILQSRVHEVWTLATCGWHGVGNDPTYNPNLSYLTFPFPEPTKTHREAIAAAAIELERLRNNWLYPPEWTCIDVLEFPGSVAGPWCRYIDTASVGPSGIGQVKYPRTAPRDEAFVAALKKRTLTNLYNERPTWLDLAHRRLDEAVLAAYGWPIDLGDEKLVASLFEMNFEAVDP